MKKQEKRNIYRYFNNTFYKFKILKKIIITETVNVDFHNEFIKFGLFVVFFFYFLHTVGFNFLIYIYIYIYKKSLPENVLDATTAEQIYNQEKYRIINIWNSLFKFHVVRKIIIQKNIPI